MNNSSLDSSFFILQDIIEAITKGETLDVVLCSMQRKKLKNIKIIQLFHPQKINKIVKFLYQCYGYSTSIHSNIFYVNQYSHW